MAFESSVHQHRISSHFSDLIATVGQSWLLILTLLGALIAGVLQRQADRAVMSCAIFPVGDDLSGRRTVRHCREEQILVTTKLST